MDHDADSQEARQAPLDSSGSFACWRPDPAPSGAVFLADRDMTDHAAGVYCARQDTVVDVAKEIYYGVKILKTLREIVPPIVP